MYNGEIIGNTMTGLNMPLRQALRQLGMPSSVVGITIENGNYVYRVVRTPVEGWHEASILDVETCKAMGIDAINRTSGLSKQTVDSLVRAWEAVIPNFPVSRYLDDDNLQKGIDLYISYVSKVFAPVYIKYNPWEDKIFLWHRAL